MGKSVCLSADKLHAAIYGTKIKQKSVEHGGGTKKKNHLTMSLILSYPIILMTFAKDNIISLE